jgi:proteasome accessory factor B
MGVAGALGHYPYYGGRLQPHRREDAVEKRFDRDKKELREIGIPVEYIASDEQGRDGYYIPREEYFHHEVELTTDEAALLVLLGNAARQGNDAIHSNLRSALLKMAIDSPLQEEVAAAIGSRQVHAFTRGKRDRAVLDNLDRLVNAVAVRKAVKFKYVKVGGRTASERVIHPYGLGYREGEWYLVGEDQARNDLRQFKVVRIHGTVHVKKGKRPDFHVPAGFDIEEYVDRAPWEFAAGKEETAEILFAPEVAWMVDEGKRPEWSFRSRDDGYGLLELTVRKGDETHQRLLHYLASFSAQCAVLKPAWLRKQAMDHLERLRARYL